MCQLHRVAFDPNLVLQQFPPPYSLERFVHAATALGFRAAVSKVAASGLARLTYLLSPVQKVAHEAGRER